MRRARVVYLEASEDGKESFLGTVERVNHLSAGVPDTMLFLCFCGHWKSLLSSP